MASSVPVLDVFIGGFWDRYTRLVAEYRAAFRRRHRQRATCYFEHDQCDEVAGTVLGIARDCPDLRVNLIGHSWGAACAHGAAARLCREGFAVALLITVDPVGRRAPGTLADASTWINVNAAPTASNGWRGDHYALIGGKWGAFPRGRAHCHYDLPFHHNEFAALLERAPAGAPSALGLLLAAPGRAAAVPVRPRQRSHSPDPAMGGSRLFWYK